MSQPQRTNALVCGLGQHLGLAWVPRANTSGSLELSLHVQIDSGEFGADHDVSFVFVDGGDIVGPDLEVMQGNHWFAVPSH